MNCIGIFFKNVCNELYSKVMILKLFYDDDIEFIL